MLIRQAIDQARREWPDAMIVKVGDIGGDPNGKHPDRLKQFAEAAGWNVPATFAAAKRPSLGVPLFDQVG